VTSADHHRHTTATGTGPAAGHKLYPVGDSGRPRIRTGSDPDTIRVLSQALDARIIPDTYVTDGRPVVIEPVSGAGDVTAGDQDVPHPLRVNVLKPPLLASLLAQYAEVVNDKGEVTPRRDVLLAVLSRQSWPGLPFLRRVISTPVLRPDGTLLQHPGYDPATGFFLTSTRHLDPVPERPTAGQVDQACAFLLDSFLADFPWRSDADRANYLALLVTPIVRPFIRTLTPFGIVDATMPGSGKTILTSCVGLLVGQKVLTWTDSEDELRKSITTVMADQIGAVVFDNLIEGTAIESAVLARLMTEQTWTDRRLGTNTAATYPNDKVWLATGNNLRTGGDMATRSVWVRLDPNCPRPEARTGFAIPHLDTWILDPANQATVLRHVLTLILDWTAHGAPISHDAPEMRQFTKWARMLGGFLAHHGIPGFLTNAEGGRELDEDAADWGAFLLRWHTLHRETRLTANELRQTAEPGMNGSDPWNGCFRTTAHGQLPTVKTLGKLLSGQVDRWRNNVVLRRVKDSHTKQWTYWVHREPDPPP
jgi:hypothetical protein